MATSYRDHTVCGICNVSFYICQTFRTRDGRVHNTNPANKFTGTAYDETTITHDQLRENGQVQALVRKPSAQVKPTVCGYRLSESRYQDEEYFLTHRFPIGRDHHGTSHLASLPVGSRHGIRKIKMCSDEEGDCVDAFDPQNPSHALGVPFHSYCLEIFRKVSLHRNGKIVWAGLCELGMHENHAGFEAIKRDHASEINHEINGLLRENTWLHVPGTEWVAIDPFSARYSILSSFYSATPNGPDPLEQVFSGSYRLAVGSVGPGAWNYWGPRVATWQKDMHFQARPFSNMTKKGVDVVMKKKPRPLAPTSAKDTGVHAGTSNPPHAYLTIAAEPSRPPVDGTVAPAAALLTTPANTNVNPTSNPSDVGGRDLFSTIAAETLLLIYEYLPPQELAYMRLMSHRFAEIPMTHFRDRIPRDMPWAWEVIQDNGKVMAPPPGIKIDYKEMYRLVRRTTGTGIAGVRGMRNRKRIWDYCETILEMAEKVRENGWRSIWG